MGQLRIKVKPHAALRRSKQLWAEHQRSDRPFVVVAIAGGKPVAVSLNRARMAAKLEQLEIVDFELVDVDVTI